MAGDSSEEKIHAPSERKRKKAADEGQFARSREISSAAILLAGGLSLAFASGPMTRALQGITSRMFNIQPYDGFDISAARVLSLDILQTVVTALSVPLGALFLAATLAGLAQSKGQLATKALEPKPERLDPIKGFQQKLLSWTPIVELAKGVGKLVALSVVTWMAIQGLLVDLPSLATVSAGQMLQRLVDLGLEILMGAMPLVILIAVGDYAYQVWKTTEDLKMSTQEVKEERKQTEGNPQIKAARRRRAREIAMGIGIHRVQEADVVVTNPTHYAVALRYNRDEAPAPIILAMGVDGMALKIRTEASRHDIPQVENRSLARGLYAAGKIGQMVPEELYAAVAQIIAVVYKRRQARRRAQGLH
jgi:flagellar biosynthetic protein FlhB